MCIPSLSSPPLLLLQDPIFSFLCRFPLHVSESAKTKIWFTNMFKMTVVQDRTLVYTPGRIQEQQHEHVKGRKSCLTRFLVRQHDNLLFCWSPGFINTGTTKPASIKVETKLSAKSIKLLKEPFNRHRFTLTFHKSNGFSSFTICSYSFVVLLK